ncbi:MAG: glycosyltransferase [Planctomyces sp.]
MIRIAFVIPTLDQSGAERQLTLLAQSLPRDLYQTHVFALNRGGYFADELRSAGIPVTILGKRFRFDPLTWYRLRKELSRFHPDIVQSYLFSANSYVRLPGICPKGCRIVVSERCVDSWKSSWQLKLDRWLVSRTDAMTANSNSVAEFYQAVGVPGNLLHVIPNSIPAPSSDVPRDRTSIQKEFGLDEDCRLIGYVGRLARQKRLEDLIWAFQLLRQVVNGSRLILIGDGPERDALADVAIKLDCRNLITFTGHRDDADRLMEGLDVFCLASEFEGMSNSLMEAMAMGIPCVASNIPSNRELIRSEENGLLFEPGNAPDLMKQLRRVLDDPDLAIRLGEAGHQQIVGNHSVDRMVSEHCRLYESLLLQN